MAYTTLIIVLYAIIPGLQSLLYIIDLPFVTFGGAVNYIFSIFTYYAVFSHLLISVKIPMLQRLFPYDRMIKFHAISGIVLTASIYYHGVYKLLIGKLLKPSSIALGILWTVLLFLAVIWIETPLTRRIRSFLFKRHQKLKDVSYDLLKDVHNYLFYAFALIAYIHVNESDFLYSSYGFINLYGTYVPIITAAVIVYSRVKMLFLPRMSVVGVRNEAETLVITLEPKKGRKVHYRAGQFGYLKVIKKGMKREKHPFSFLSTPHEQQVLLGIRALGDYTRSLKTLSLGDTVRINGGFGNFIPKNDGNTKVFIGSGIGIVPLVSLIMDMRRNPPKGNVIAFLAVTVREELLFEAKLREIEEEIDNLTIHFYVYQEDGILYSAQLFNEQIAHPEKAHYYLCSSTNVRQIVTAELSTLGVRKRQILFEAFSY